MDDENAHKYHLIAAPCGSFRDLVVGGLFYNFGYNRVVYGVEGRPWAFRYPLWMDSQKGWRDKRLAEFRETVRTSKGKIHSLEGVVSTEDRIQMLTID